MEVGSKSTIESHPVVELPGSYQQIDHPQYERVTYPHNMASMLELPDLPAELAALPLCNNRP
jgi:hypothetical protein